MLLCCWDKTLTKSNLGNKRIYLAYMWESIMEGSQTQELKAGTRKQELKQRAWRNAALDLAKLSYSPGVASGYSDSYSGLNNRISIVSYGNFSQTWLQSSLIWAVNLRCPQMMLGYINLTVEAIDTNEWMNEYYHCNEFNFSMVALHKIKGTCLFKRIWKI